jgi:hypothetical protein
MKRARSLRITGATALLVALWGSALLAATTGIWMTATAKDFARGKLENVTILSTGQLAPGMGADRFKMEEISVWATAFSPDGTAYVGTGNNGRVYRVKKDGVEKVFETGEAVVTCLAWADGKLYAGTIPSGKIFGWKPGDAEAKLVADLTVPYVWKMVYHKDLGALVVGTGPGGQVHTVTPEGKTKVFFDSNESHVLSLAVGEKGAIYAGTSMRGVLFKFAPDGKVLGTWDLDDNEVRALSFHDGSLYVGANKIKSYERDIYFMGQEGMLQDRSQFARMLAAQISQLRESEQAAEKGFQELFEATLYRMTPGKSMNRILGIPKRYLCDIGVDKDKVIYAATGDEGELWAATEPNLGWVMMDLKEAQILSVGMHAGQLRLVATGNAAALYRTRQGAAKSAQFTSEVKDTGFRSRWGSIEWKSTGPVQVLTRTGSHSIPDKTWSDWSRPLEKSGSKITSPDARFVQFRLRWKEGSDSKVDWVRMAFINDNQRPRIEKLVTARIQDAFPASKGLPDVKPDNYYARQLKEAKGKVRVSWQAVDPDGDTLLYWLYYRREGDKEWVIINPKKPVQASMGYFNLDAITRMKTSTKKLPLQRVTYEWNTATLADGWYMLKVVASDERDNSKEAKKVWKEIGPLLIDNRKPEIAELKETGELAWKGLAKDGTSHIARIEYNLDGEKWEMVKAKDGIYDNSKEEFSIVLKNVMPGEHVLTVRAFDEGGNFGLRQVGFKVKAK